MTVKEILSYFKKIKKFDLILNREKVYKSEINKLHKQIGRNQKFAQELWNTKDLDAMYLAVEIAEPKKFTSQLLDKWVQNISTWEVCDTFCGKIACFTPFVEQKIQEWSKSEELYIRRSAFSLVCALCFKKCKRSDEDLLKFLPFIELYSHDSRDEVRKAINWSIRQMGKRSKFLQSEILKFTEELKRKYPDSSNVFWICNRRIDEVKNKTFK